MMMPVLAKINDRGILSARQIIAVTYSDDQTLHHRIFCIARSNATRWKIATI